MFRGNNLRMSLFGTYRLLLVEKWDHLHESVGENLTAGLSPTLWFKPRKVLNCFFKNF